MAFVAQTVMGLFPHCLTCSVFFRLLRQFLVCHIPGSPARCPFAVSFFGEGSPTKLENRKKEYPYSNLSTGGPIHGTNNGPYFCKVFLFWSILVPFDFPSLVHVYAWPQRLTFVQVLSAESGTLEKPRSMCLALDVWRPSLATRPVVWLVWEVGPVLLFFWRGGGCWARVILERKPKGHVQSFWTWLFRSGPNFLSFWTILVVNKQTVRTFWAIHSQDMY